MISETLADDINTLYPNSLVILSKQLKKIEDENSLFVLCTCAFYIPDYNPKLIENFNSI